MAMFLSGVSVMVGFIGILMAARYARENRRLTRRLRRFTWHDIESGVHALCTRIEHEYAPDLILCSSAGSVGIVANLYVAYTPRFIPLYLGVSRMKDGTEFASTPLFTGQYVTSRWETFLPSNLQETRANRILILEDVVISGATLTEMVGILRAQGFRKDQIKTAALFSTAIGELHGQRPDYYWLSLDEDFKFELPWGSSVGKFTR